MARITREPGLNSGLPEQDGLDEGTRAHLQRQLDAGGKAVIVGGFQDVQRKFGEAAVDETDETVSLPPGETPDSVLTTAEHDALTNPAATGSGTASFSDENTVDELKAELERRGEPTSGNKQELLDRLNG